MGIYENVVSPFYMTIVNTTLTTGQPVSGFNFELQNEIARRGNLRFEYVLVDGPYSEHVDRSIYLLELTNGVDIVGCDWEYDISSWRFQGISFSQPIVDASLVLATNGHIKPEIKYWDFITPFSAGLWKAIIGLSVVNGFLFFILSEDNKHSLFRTLYLSVTAFTTAEVNAAFFKQLFFILMLILFL